MGDAESEPAAQAEAAVLGANPFVRIDRSEMLSTAARTVGRVLGDRERRRGLLRSLRCDLSEVARGSSEVKPGSRDRRFGDPTWSDNAVFRQLMQVYLVTEREIRGLSARAELEGSERDRANFLLTMIADALAPTNLLVGNPAALKRVFETGGRSLVTGARHLVDDVRHNGAMPSMVDLGPFAVGETVATTTGEVVHRTEVLELLRYSPATTTVYERPLLVVPPQINKYYVLDLAPGRSMVEHAVGAGEQVFMISWRNPTRDHATWDLTRYVDEVESAIDVACDLTKTTSVNLVGACAGGITSTATAAHLAALDKPVVNSLTLLVTVLDFATPNAMNMFASDQAIAAAKARSTKRGVLDGRDLARMFAWMRPNDLVWNYWVNNYLMGESPPAFDVLAWNSDTTNLPAALHHDFLDIFGANALPKPGQVIIDGTPIDLGAITADVFCVGALTDHITPWTACYRTPHLVGGEATFVLSSSGHIQALVNPPTNPKSRFFTNADLPESPEAWRAGATENQGSWWDHWMSWLEPRSGNERRAPRQAGSKAHPALGPAPGIYVHE